MISFGEWRLGEPVEHKQSAGSDIVNNPDHYTSGDIECIEAIKAALSPQGFVDYCRGNVLKYTWRCNHKGGMEDLKKARKYLDFAIGEEDE